MEFKFIIELSGVNNGNTNQQYQMMNHPPPLQQFSPFMQNSNSQPNLMQQSANNSMNMNPVYGFNQPSMTVGSNNQNPAIQSSAYMLDDSQLQQYFNKDNMNQQQNRGPNVCQVPSSFPPLSQSLSFI